MVDAALDLVDRFKDDDFVRASLPTLQTLGFIEPAAWSGGDMSSLGAAIRPHHQRHLARAWLTEVFMGSARLDASALALIAIRLAAISFFATFSLTAHPPSGDE